MSGVATLVALWAGCIGEPTAPSGDDDSNTGSDTGSAGSGDDDAVNTVNNSYSTSAACNGADATAYTPFTLTGSPSGTVGAMPWIGVDSSYPNGDEDFSGYGLALPISIECSDEKSMRPYLDVTAGCLSAISLGTYTRGQIHAEADDAFRMVALGHVGSNPAPTKWTDTGVSYRFYYTGTSGTANNPGFKAFLRYRSEDDLYVASWRVDGTVQIQRKHCGVYTALVMNKGYGAPSKNAWHTIEFTAVGTLLQVTLDGKVAMSANDSTFSWGTAGIRADAMEGAYLDDWRVFAP